MLTRPDRSAPRPLLLAVLASLAMSLGACSSGAGGGDAKRAPLSAITDNSARTGDRTRAIRRVWDAVDAGEIDHASGRELLKKAAWSRRLFYKVRLAAFEELVRDEENIEDTRGMMRLMLPTETQWDVIDFLGRTAADRGWTDLTAALVRCWARPVAEPPDDERPERSALQRLHPDRAVEDVVFDVFIGAPGLGPAKRSAAESREREQQDAWMLLCRLDKGGDRLTDLLARSGPREESTPAVEALRAGASQLGVVPTTAEQLAWLQRLRTPAFSAAWSEYAAVVSRLSPEQRRGLALRHLAGLRWAASARPDWMSASREELLSRLEMLIKPRRKHEAAGAATAAVRAPESLATWRDRMVWGDALMALIAAELVEDADLAALIFHQAEEDRRDTSTEYGGVIDGVGSGFGVRFFPPRPSQRFGDRRFVASAEMIEQGSDSMFHYHLHCTSYTNAQYAGPSREDMLYAESQGRACLVFTFINRNVLNVDYFQPGGVVIDLGEMRRP